MPSTMLLSSQLDLASGGEADWRRPAAVVRLPPTAECFVHERPPVTRGPCISPRVTGTLNFLTTLTTCRAEARGAKVDASTHTGGGEERHLSKKLNCLDVVLCRSDGLLPPAPPRGGDEDGDLLRYGCLQSQTRRPETGRGAVVDLPLLRAAGQTVRRFSAEDLPVLRLATTSKETFCPSLRPCIPARSTALMCTKTSLPPSSGWMKPKPFLAIEPLHGSLRHIALLSVGV